MKTNTAIIASLFTSLIISTAVAAPTQKAQPTPTPKAQLTLESQAQTEIATLTSGATKAESAQSTDAVLPAESLTLKDEFQSPRARNYDLGFAFSLRPHNVRGTGQIPSAGSYALTAGNTVMPVLGLGLEKNFISTPGNLSELRVGLNGNVGFVSQEMSVALQNQITNVRLNSTSTEVELFSEISFTKLPRVGLGASYGISQLSVTQTGSASLSQWTKQLRQNVSSIFASYRLNPSWSAQVAYLSRSDIGSDQPDLRQDKSLYQAGFKVIW